MKKTSNPRHLLFLLSILCFGMMGITGFADDDLFSNEFMIEDLGEPETEAQTSTQGRQAFESLLTTEKVELGGRFFSSISSTWTWPEVPDTWDNFIDAQDRLGLNLGAELFFDARPSARQRFFGKIRTTYPFNTMFKVDNPDAGVTNPLEPAQYDISQLNIEVRELYTDLTHKDSLFFRFGKQTVNWGVGSYYRPSDIISLTPVDFDDPNAEREGPLALKVNLPWGNHSFDAYLIANEQVRSYQDLGIAARAEFYLAPVELGLGTGWQKDRPLSFISTLRLPMGDWIWHADGRLNFGRQGGKIVDSGFEETDDAIYPSAALGFMYLNSDHNITLLGQYFFHGEGYGDVDFADGVLGVQLFSWAIDPTIFQYFGRHHTVLTINKSQFIHDDLGISFMWLGSWSDGSGQVSSSLNWRVFDGFSLSSSLAKSYGDSTSQFGFFPSNLQFTLSAGIGGGRF